MKRFIFMLFSIGILAGLLPSHLVFAQTQSGSYHSSAQLISDQVSISYPMWDPSVNGIENATILQNPEITISKLTVENQLGYCIQSDIVFSEGIYDKKYTGAEAIGILKQNQRGLSYTDDQITRAKQISSVGYGYNGDTSNDMYAATQILLWRIKHPNEVTVKSASIDAKIKEIEARLQVFSKRVSFGNANVQLKGYGKENGITLKDTNQIFSQYSLASNVVGGLHVDKQGNTVTIWADKGLQGTHAVQFNTLYGNQGVNDAVTVYTKNTSQTLAVFGKVPTPSIQISVQVDIKPSKGKLVVNKVASQLVGVEWNEENDVKEFIYEDRGLKGTEFDLIAKENIKDPITDKVVFKKGDLVSHLTTNENGQASIDNLYFGHYSLIETQVPHGFVLDDTPVDIQINDKEVFNKVIEQQAPIYDEKQRLEWNIQKVSSVDKKGIEGAVFHLISNENIVDIQGNILISQGQVIKTLTSDEEGNIIVDLDCPIGSYSLQEVSAPLGHILNEEPILFQPQLESKDHVFTFDQVIENEFEKLPFTIFKVDKETGKTIDQEVTFGLYEDQKAEKEIQVQNGKGQVTFENLDPGTYYLKEVKAPDGYYRSDRIHSIQITREGKVYIDGDESEKLELTVENEKIKEIIKEITKEIPKETTKVINQIIETGLKNGVVKYSVLCTGMAGILGCIYYFMKKKK